MLPVNPNVINGLIDGIFLENFLLIGRIGVEPAAVMNLLLVGIDRVTGPPEVELQGFLEELPPGARRIAGLEGTGNIDESVGVGQSLHINDKVVNSRIDVGPR